MTDKDKDEHTRLLILHEAGGEIEGRAKYHKLLFNYYDEEVGESELGFVTEERGPFDPGLSKAVKHYIDLNLLEVDEDEEPHDFSQTEKCERYMSGYEQAKRMLDVRFQETKEKVRNTIEKHGDKSASEMVARDNVQEAKDNPLRKKLE